MTARGWTKASLFLICEYKCDATRTTGWLLQRSRNRYCSQIPKIAEIAKQSFLTTALSPLERRIVFWFDSLQIQYSFWPADVSDYRYHGRV
jgi:hypothetical protein